MLTHLTSCGIWHACFAVLKSKPRNVTVFVIFSKFVALNKNKELIELSLGN